ncbi:SLATT domain-containing protein [Mesorhizobium sp. M0113]|uniref:SLATT domain-containing protein n=1 Tax=Mesorhizobium sp. M0113 TaxID=2956881 RepID=UPI0033363C09
MAQPSQFDPRFQLESQVRECYGRCAYTHKIHEKMAERLADHQWYAKWFNIILSALIAGGAVTTVFRAQTGLLQYAEYATVVLSILSLIYNAYQKDLDPGALAQRHRETASDIWNVRESYLSLITDALNSGVPIDDLRAQRDGLQTDLHEIYRAAPFTDGKAYKRAQDSLKDNEELMFSDKEIDDMLPTALRRSGRA